MPNPSQMQELDLKTVNLKGHNLIEASAGTGKTFAIAALYLRLILEKALSVDQILVVTFTVAATEELKDRIRNRLNQALEGFSDKLKDDPDPFLSWVLENFEAQKARPLLQNAVRNFDRCAIFTIHGFCQRTLVENAFAGSSLFETELLNDQSHLIQETVNDFWRKNILQGSPLFNAFLQNKNISPTKLTVLAQKCLNHPLIRIKPDPDYPRSSEYENRFLQLKEKGKALWEQEKQSINELLLSKALNKNSYREKSIPIWMEEMQAFLDSEIPSPSLFDKFENFTAEKLATKTKRGQTPPAHPFFDLCQDLFLAAEELRKVFTQHLESLQAQCLEFVRSELPRRKENRGLLYFDDLLLKMHKALNGPTAQNLSRAIASQYQAGLIDEFQDTDPVQYNIFSRLFTFEEHPLFLIGDPKQAIYSFRGADVFAYRQACQRVNQAYTMQVNWRSDPDLIQAANTIFSANSKPFVFDFFAYTPVKPAAKERENLYVENDPSPLRIWFLENDEHNKGQKYLSQENAEIRIAQAVAAEISRLLALSVQGKAYFYTAHSYRPLLSGDLAVLVRSHDQAALVRNQLRQKQIPCVLSQSGNLMDSPEAASVQRILAAVCNFSDWATLRAALATELIGLNASDLDKLQENQSNWDEWLEKFATYHDLWAEKGFIFFFESFLQREKVRSKLLGLDGGERKLTNVLHLMEILHQQEKEEHLGQNALLSWLEENMNPDAMRLEEHELRLESDAQAVQIITIHKSKGLEYPIVFSPFLHKGSKPQPPIVFHDQEEENVLTMYLGSEYMETWQAQAEKEQLAENMRLFYVALTRAKHRCYLSWGAINKSQTSAWAHLLYGSTSSDSDFDLKELESNVDTLDKSAFKAPLEKLGSNCPAIKVTSPPKAEYDYNRTDQRQENLIPITFNRILQKNWRLSSFSALIKAQSSLEGKDQDEELQFSFTSDPLEKEQELNMHSFPRGAKSGTLLHSILEETDFQKTHPEETEKIISNKLEAYGYCLDWLPVLQDMLANLVQIPLNPAKTLRLNTVSPQERLNELEFYLPLDYLSVSKLSSVYRQFFSDHAFGNIAQRIQDLGFSPHQGFLRGFIDLIFEKQGIFYLVDWKSNHLGSEVADYHKDLLVNPIVEELYFLQYHLYTVALDAYLRSHMPGYDYQLNFGGVIYVFLRGLDIQAGPEYGVFYDLPDPEFIKQLSLTLFPEDICFYAT